MSQKTFQNWIPFIVVIIILLIGGVFFWQYSKMTGQRIVLPGWEKLKEKAEKEIVPPKKELKTPEPGGWETYTNEEYGFKIDYPKDFTIESIDKGVKFIFPESYKNLSYQYKNDVVNAWLGVAIGLMKEEGFEGNFCEGITGPPSENVKINNLDFLKTITGSAAMGGWYSEYHVYGTSHNGLCYEIILNVNGHGIGQEPEVNSSDKEKFISILNKFVSSFRFLD